MAAMTVSSSETDCILISRDKASAWPNSVVLRYCMLKSYPSRMIAHRCNRLAEYTGIPFFLAEYWKKWFVVRQECKVTPE